MLDIWLDDHLGVLRCVSRGLTPLHEAEAFGRKAALLQAAERNRRGRCLILVDASATVPQTQDTMAHMSDIAIQREPGDRTAIVISSALARLQAQRASPRDGTAYFTDEMDAIDWLLAEPC